jgi:hypothetical protein
LSEASRTTRPTAKPPENLTFSEFLAALESSGKTRDAAELNMEISEALGLAPAILGPRRWGDVVAGLRMTLGAASQAIYSGLPGDDSEILLGDAVPDEQAFTIMQSLNADWRQFKQKHSRGR